MRRVGLAFAIGILLSALSVSPAFAQASISGVVQDASGAVLPGGHRRGDEPRPDRENADGRHRRLRPLQHRRPASGHLRGDVLADRLQHRQARGHRAERQLRRAGQRRAARREPRGNHHRLGRLAGRRRHEHADADGADQGADRGAAGRPHHPGARRAGAGRDGDEREHRRHRARVGVDRQPHDDRRLQVGHAPRRPRHRPARRRQRHADAGSDDRGAGLRRQPGRAPSTRSAACA